MTSVPPADHGQRAEIYDFVRIGWFVYQMCRALNRQLKSGTQGVYV